MIATTLPTIGWDRFDTTDDPKAASLAQPAVSGETASSFGPFSRILASEPPAEPPAKASPQPPAVAIGSAIERRFIEAAVGPAQESQRATGVPASVTIAQAILESDWGMSQLARQERNYFGIKAHGQEGTAGTITFPTWEVIGGQNVTVQAAFRAYHTMVDSFVDHGRFFIENRRYGKALQHKHDAREFARQIALAGYATDSAYADKLIRLMEKFGLFAFDLS